MRDTLVILAAIALIATSAQALDVNTSVTYSGAGNAETGLHIGVTSAGSVTVSTGADLTISGSGTGGLLLVGAGDSGNLTIVAGATVNADGNYYWPPEQEHASFSIGGQGDATATIAGTFNAAYDGAIGMDYTWSNHANADVTITGTWNVGWTSIGAMDDGNTVTVLHLDGATINGAMMHAGGTLELTGSSTTTQNIRIRDYSAVRTVIKPIGAAPSWDSAKTLQIWGADIDVSAITLADFTWHKLLTGLTSWNSGWYTAANHDLTFAPSTNLFTGIGDNGWVKRERSVWNGSIWELSAEIMYIPEPATMALLAIGGIGALLRKRR